MKMNIQLFGLNHRSAPIEVREKAAFSASGLKSALDELKKCPEIGEAIILSTCNRTEIYVAASDPIRVKKSLKDFICRHSGLCDDDIGKHFYFLDDKEAIEHLYRVASSLDSMIVGETQVFGQVKDAYFRARDCKASGKILENIFEGAIRAGKRVRTETQIGKGAISTSTAAIELARKIFESLEDKKVLIIGAGKIGELTVKNLSSRGVNTVIVANRTLVKARELASRFMGEAIEFEAVGDYMRVCDIIISSTSAPHFVITRKDLAGVMRSRNNAPLFLIDLGLPRNIEPQANDLENVYLYNIDDLAQVCDANLKDRLVEAQKAQKIIECCVEMVFKKLEPGCLARERVLS